jgi:hypothetical protein
MQETISRDIILKTEKYKLRMPNATDIDFVFSATQFPWVFKIKSHFNKSPICHLE